ncbi:MAG: caspase family protein [Opitutales bacterium]|nr:caspase family protein [Opitutales bacterium]
MKKRAVIVGINRYEDSDHIRALRCAEQDARGLDKFLEHRLGFENLTLLGSEATSREVNEAVRESCAGLGEGDLFLFYFAGHGSENHLGQILLCHGAVYPHLEAKAATDVIPVESLYRFSDSCGASRILIIDACRDHVDAGRSGDAFGEPRTQPAEAESFCRGAGAFCPAVLLPQRTAFA